MKITVEYKSAATRQSVAICVSMFLILAIFLICQADAQTVAPLSEGWYRLPYSEQLPGFEGISHGGNLFIDHPGYDMNGKPMKVYNDESPHMIVAMAAGEVIEVVDYCNECSDPDFGFTPRPCSHPFQEVVDKNGVPGCLCNNFIWIEHPNGEITAYLHIAYNSAQVQEGDPVYEGQYIADEGDVGSTNAGADSENNRWKHGCSGTQPYTAFLWPKCGIHLHLSVVKPISGVVDPRPEDMIRLIPRICDIDDHVIQQTDTDLEDVGPCSASCVSDISETGNYTDRQKVVAASNSITTDGNVIIQNSVIGYEAGNRITLKPGFKASAGSYFRASIGTCNSST